MAEDSGRVDAAGIVLDSDWEAVLDVLVEDHRIFSITPSRHKAVDGRRLSPWPEATRRFLTGTGHVVVREHLSQDVLIDEEVRFDNGPGRVAIVDAEGYQLAMDKWGALARPFEASGTELGNQLVADVRDLLALLNGRFDDQAFIAYGTLLGAVRGGRLIAHDNDADISFYSRHQHPADVARESYEVERFLLESGWRVRRRTGAFIQVWSSDEAAQQRKIDIFASYHCNGWFAVERWVRAQVPPSAILPLGQIELEGVSLPCPADPRAVLEATYGPTWEVPDPSFKFVHPPSARNRANGWLGTPLNETNRLKTFTEDPAAPESPSPFALWAGDRLTGDGTLVELGCGLGEDTGWFARDGRPVIGVDYARTLVDRARAAAPGLRFEPLAPEDLRGVLGTATAIALQAPSVELCVHRSLEFLGNRERSHLWLFTKVVVPPGGLMCLEFLVGRLRPRKTRSYRNPQPLDPEKVAAEIGAHGGVVAERELFGAEDDQRCRMLVRW